MKKHNEGYALVLVLVVITVLSLVAMAMMAASLKNLQNQQKSIDRMEAKYAAQGEIEKVITKIDNQIAVSNGFLTNFDQGLVEEMCGAGMGCELNLMASNDPNPDLQYDNYLLLILTAEESGTKIDCTIRITGTIKTDSNTGKFNISNPRWEYVSYTVTEGGGA